jgi:cytochrome bd ubiquinol oxidase subunit II
MLLICVVSILFIALSFYTIFGGADYGAGIISLTSIFNKKTKDKEQKIIAKAIGPVWEANHMWLIIVVVILFVGFPNIYYNVCVYLHWPLVMILIGIVARGAAFTYMHYDPDQEKTHNVYNLIFSLSSIWTPFWLGVTIASLNYGLIGSTTNDYWQSYIAPWCHSYAFCVGLFSICNFAFLASVFLIGESSDQEIVLLLTKKAKIFFSLMILTGICVFVVSLQSTNSLFTRFIDSNISIFLITLVTLLIFPMLQFLNNQHLWRSRFLASFIVLCILGGWGAADLPTVILLVENQTISFHSAQAPYATLFHMLIALFVGVLIIFPALGFLHYTFQHKK